MDKSQKSEASEQVDFVLKHRVVGAGILLLFGALVLPWLLGPPTEASKVVVNSDSDSAGRLAGLEQESESQDAFAALLSDKNKIEDELLEAIDAEGPEIEEQVYISKITPLDIRSAEKPTKKSESKEVAGKSSDKTPAKAADPKTPDSDKASPDLTVAKSAKTEAIEKKVDNKDSDKTDKKVASAKPVVEAKSKPVEQAPATTVSAASTKVELGWVVQVGVFTDKKGAEKVVQDLQSKGFTPSTSIVDTNRGKGTGTRVWLGPFAQRVDAAKTKTRLTTKTGEPGFIRAYP